MELGLTHLFFKISYFKYSYEAIVFVNARQNIVRLCVLANCSNQKINFAALWFFA